MGLDDATRWKNPHVGATFGARKQTIDNPLCEAFQHWGNRVSFCAHQWFEGDPECG